MLHETARQCQNVNNFFAFKVPLFGKERACYLILLRFKKTNRKILKRWSRNKENWLEIVKEC